MSRATPTTRTTLPGFTIGLSITLAYLGLLLGAPLVACIVKVSSLSWTEFVGAVWTDRARAALAFSFGAAFSAAVISAALGLLVAWVLVRYRFAGRRVLDAMIDVPFALPTAVAGLVYSSLYVEQGWLGQFLVPLGVHAAYSRLAVVLVLTFLGFPFVVRTIQPVLEELDTDAEEAAHLLGASPWQRFWYVILPAIRPAAFTGFVLAFARGLGEYGSVVFVSGNLPFRTEITPVLIVARLEEFQYAEATALAVMLLLISFSALILVNQLQRRSPSHAA